MLNSSIFFKHVADLYSDLSTLTMFPNIFNAVHVFK